MASQGPLDHIHALHFAYTNHPAMFHTALATVTALLLTRLFYGTFADAATVREARTRYDTACVDSVRYCSCRALAAHAALYLALASTAFGTYASAMGAGIALYIASVRRLFDLDCGALGLLVSVLAWGLLLAPFVLVLALARGLRDPYTRLRHPPPRAYFALHAALWAFNVLIPPDQGVVFSGSLASFLQDCGLLLTANK